MTTELARLINICLFLLAWLVATYSLSWLSTNLLLETSDFTATNVPQTFRVVVEQAGVNGAKPTYTSIPLNDVPSLQKWVPGGSLHLTSRAYSDLDLPEVPSACCIDFKVLEDGPAGQLIEHNNDDMSYLRSRYRVHNGQVTPLLLREDFTLYYLGYLIAGAIIAMLATSRWRRRVLAKVTSGKKQP